jgi:hypothetical protein
MTNDWYVQQAGKTFGPLTSVQLKKLAGEGKIKPDTSVRRGTTAAWVPASRVQGLFAPPAAPAKPSSAPTQVLAKGPTQVVGKTVAPVTAVSPPIAPPVAVPVRAPAARAPLGSFGSVPKATPTAGGSTPAKILGAVALIFGTLALATFWLPAFGAMGWIGIGVGIVGLLIGIGGLVISARHQASGLYLNVAGASTSLVGLVLTVVFGVLFGLFTRAAPARVALVLPVAQPAPPPVAAEPEPVPEPEIVWTPSTESIEQGPIKASIVSAKVESVRFERDLFSGKPVKPIPMLKIRLRLENTSTDKIVECPGWPGSSSGGLVGGDVGKLLEGSELGKAVQAAAPGATLVDNVGNPYKQTPAIMLFGGKSFTQDLSVRPGGKSEPEVVFQPPLETIEYVRLELSPAGFSGSEPLRFQIENAAIARDANGK